MDNARHISEWTKDWFKRKGLDSLKPSRFAEDYYEKHGADHDAENAETRDAMDMRDHFDELHP